MKIASDCGKAVVHMKSAETMLEDVEQNSVKLLVIACTHLGGWDTWADYKKLVTHVGNQDGFLALRNDGYAVLMQTDAYVDGCVMPRAGMMLHTFVKEYEIIDAKIWKRKKADFRQPPYSHFWMFRPRGGTAKRPSNSDTEYFSGVWDYPAVSRGKLNGWPDKVCELLIRSMTEPGDLIVDPFCGSARLLGMAAKMGRKAVGYEIDMDLVDTIRENLNPRGLL